jgi:hypothetical protein
MTRERELEIGAVNYLIKNSLEVQHLLQEDRLKELAINLFKAGYEYQTKTLEEDMITEEVNQRIEDDQLVRYSYLLPENI